MKLRAMRFGPRRLTTQIIVLVAISAGLFHVCMQAAFFIDHSGHAAGRPHQRLNPLDEFVSAIKFMPIEEREAFAAEFSRLHGNMSIRFEPPRAPAGSEPSAELTRASSRKSSDQQVQHAFLDDGTMVTLTEAGPWDERGPPPTSIVFATISFVTLSITLFIAWTVHYITRPLDVFAKAVDRFSIDQAVNNYLPEDGPIELSTAARAFNRMQERITNMVQSRVLMLAVVSHDLRTPITRLRLRAELITDPKIRIPVLRDLEHMESMAQDALSFIRDGISDQTMSPLDLPSLLQTVCDDFADMGATVTYEGPNHCVVRGNYDGLRRAVTNLVGNAVKAASTVLVTLDTALRETVKISIIDDGYGIIETERERMMEPFVRAPASPGAGGFGLGLPIAKAIAIAHGGRLDLADRQPHGLICKITLPRYDLQTAA